METEVVSEPSCMSSSSLRETSSEAQMAKSRCDPVSMYELEVRKAKSLIALDSNFFRVVLQDFDLKKYTLMPRKYVVVHRKCFYDSNESTRWLYSCSCNPFDENFLSGLAMDTDFVQNDKDICLHIKVSRILISELHSFDESEDPFDHLDGGDLTEEVNDITFAKDTVVVTAGGSIGVVHLNGTKLSCFVCDKPHCCHTNYMREIKNKKKKDLPDYLQEIFAKQSEVNHSRVKASLSRRKIPFTVSNTVTMKPPSEYLRNEHGVSFCEDITKDCFYSQRETLATSSLKDMVLYYKNYSFPCKGLLK
uniref:Uncharacterized protein n=1 Tax=Clytia hemisphaerica TaxID=252671 RepID=A0A7M6DRZ6_9CNID